MIKRSKECLKCNTSLTCLAYGVPDSVTSCRYCREAFLFYASDVVTIHVGQIECRHPGVIKYVQDCRACNAELRVKTKRCAS